MKNLDLMTLQRSFALSALLLVSACGDPGAELGELQAEQQAVWVNLGGRVTANPFYDQVVDNYPQNSRGLPLLHSRPNASAVIFLDYDGGTFEGSTTRFAASDYERIGTSSSNLKIAKGSKVFATQSGLGYQVGNRVRAVPTWENFGNYMEGSVTAYASGNLTVNVDTIGIADATFADTFNAWRIQNLTNVTFNAEERRSILDQWHAMAMWYSLFDFDVTTEQPASGSTKPALRIAMTYSNGGLGGWFPTATAVSGDWPGPNSNPAHEGAHSFGIEHTAEFDFLGIQFSEYSTSASTPIITSFMGDGSEQVEKMVKWTAKLGGTYGLTPLDVNKIQGELTMIQQRLTQEGAQLAPLGEPDGSADFSSSRTGAAPLTDLGEHSYARSGHINVLSDVDYFSFQPTLDGYYSIVVGRDAPSVVDTAVTIESSTGSVLASADGDPSDPAPTTNVYDQKLTRFFTAGTYFIKVTGHGGYADMGQYIVRAGYVGDSSAPWQVNDIGVNGVPGYAMYDPDGHTYQIAGSGREVYDVKDGLTMMSQQLKGDGFISARVTHLDTYNNDWAFAGISIRDSLKPGAKHATLVMTKRHGWEFIYRDATGGVSVDGAEGNLSFTAKYLKINRIGNSFSFYASSDGVSWGSPLVTKTISMATTRPVHIGLVASGRSAYTIDPLTGHNPSELFGQRLALGAIRNVVISATGSGVLNPEPYAIDPNLAAPTLTIQSTTYEGVSLSWSDFNTTEAGYIVERSNDRIVWAEVTTRSANTTTYTDTGLGDARTYYYRVRAKASSGAASQPSTTRSAVTKPGRVNTLTMRTYTLEGGAIVLYWDDIDGETQYRILRQDGSGAFVEIGISGANVPIYIDASPKSTTTTYSYKIETVHPSGATTSSSAVSVATRSTSRPSPFVQNVPAPGTVPLDWANISMGPYSPDEYRIYRRDPMTEWALRTTVTSSAFTDTNVVPGTSYTYQVVGCTTAAPRVCSAAGTVTASPL